MPFRVQQRRCRCRCLGRLVNIGIDIDCLVFDIDIDVGVLRIDAVPPFHIVHADVDVWARASK